MKKIKIKIKNKDFNRALKNEAFNHVDGKVSFQESLNKIIVLNDEYNEGLTDNQCEILFKNSVLYFKNIANNFYNILTNSIDMKYYNEEKIIDFLKKTNDLPINYSPKARSFLCIAIDRRYALLTDELLKSGSDVNYMGVSYDNFIGSPFYYSPLSSAIKTKNIKMLEKLINYNVNFSSSKAFKNLTAAEYALESDFKEGYKMLKNYEQYLLLNKSTNHKNETLSKKSRNKIL